MSRLPWRSLGWFLDLDHQIDSAFEELIHKPWGRLPRQEGWWPAVDIYETDEEYLVVADLPGVAPMALQVTVTTSELTIRGNRDVQSEIRRGQTVRIERERGEFYRRIPLSQAVDRDRVETRFEHGQLIVRLPKRGHVKEPGTRP